MTYTGKNFPSLAASKARTSKAKVTDNSTDAVAALESEAAMAYPRADNLPLTISDFRHAYDFILATQEGLKPKQLDQFLATYYSHIRLECMAHVLKLTAKNPAEPADQAKVEASIVAGIDTFLATGKEIK